MKAMILAAGKGERMRPLTLHTPKPLLPVGGKPLIQWHIERLARAGLRELVINHAWLGEQLEARLGDGTDLGVRIRWSAEDERLETAGGIRRALPLLAEQPFVLVTAAVWTDVEFARLRLPSGALPPLVLVANPHFEGAGAFLLQGGRVAHPRAGEQADAMTYHGVSILCPRLFDGLGGGPQA